MNTQFKPELSALFISEPVRGTELYSIGDKSYRIVYSPNQQNTAFGVLDLREYDIFEQVNDQYVALDRNDENRAVIKLIHKSRSRRCNAQRNRIMRESGHFQTDQYKKWARQNRKV